MYIDKPPAPVCLNLGVLSHQISAKHGFQLPFLAAMVLREVAQMHEFAKKYGIFG